MFSSKPSLEPPARSFNPPSLFLLLGCLFSPSFSFPRSSHLIQPSHYFAHCYFGVDGCWMLTGISNLNSALLP